MSPPPGVLIVGVGNADRGDDALGPVVARGLAGRLPPDVTILVRAGDMLSLVEDWTGYEALIIIDAAAPMGSPGRIHRIDLATEELPRTISLTSSHAFGITEAIDLSRVLGHLPRDIIVYAVEGRAFEGGASLTRDVERAAGEVAERIVAEVTRLRQGTVGRARAARHEATKVVGYRFDGHNGR